MRIKECKRVEGLGRVSRGGRMREYERKRDRVKQVGRANETGV